MDAPGHKSHLDGFAGDGVTFNEVAKSAIGAAQVDAVAVVQRGGNLIEDIEGERVQTLGRHGCRSELSRVKLTGAYHHGGICRNCNCKEIVRRWMTVKNETDKFGRWPV